MQDKTNLLLNPRPIFYLDNACARSYKACLGELCYVSLAWYHHSVNHQALWLIQVSFEGLNKSKVGVIDAVDFKSNILQQWYDIQS